MVALGLFVVAVPIIMLMGGVGSFVGRWKHLLSALLSLEYIMLSVFWLLVLSISFLGGDSYFFFFFFFTLAASEGALGLALLVSVVRTHGNDNFSSFMSLQC